MPVKKGAGKGKALKVKVETMPTPQGRRVVPRITSTMKAEANRKADKKGENKRGRKIKVCLYWVRSWLVITTVIRLLQHTNVLFLSASWTSCCILFATAHSPKESNILLDLMSVIVEWRCSDKDGVWRWCGERGAKWGAWLGCTTGQEN